MYCTWLYGLQIVYNINSLLIIFNSYFFRERRAIPLSLSRSLPASYVVMTLQWHHLCIVFPAPCVMTWNTGVSPIYHLWPLGHHLVLLVLFFTLFDPWPCVLSNCKRCHDSVSCGVPQEFGTSLPNSLSESKSWFTKSRILGAFKCLIWEISLVFHPFLRLVDLLWSNYWVLSPLSNFLMFFSVTCSSIFFALTEVIAIFSWL